MNERRLVRRTLLLALAGATAVAAAGNPTYRLVRASVDGAGGGVAEGPTYTLVVAYGQHDANPPAYGEPYAFAGGVFAAVPVDRLFVDGFE